jgi:AraC-like DNA-binding protein
MDDIADTPVDRAVRMIRVRYVEPLTLNELARAAFVTKFHLIRKFREQIGVTPGRFLCAVRLDEAKRMLRTTSLTVVDVAARVGYASTGTFTQRFSEAVGLAPSQYRRMCRGQPYKVPPVRWTAPAGGVLDGRLRSAAPLDGPVFVGIFDGPILQGRPVAAGRVDGAGPFRLAGVPAGRWYLHAVALDPIAPGDTGPERPVLAATMRINVRANADQRLRDDVVLSPRCRMDPPILFALLGLDPAAKSNLEGDRRQTGLESLTARQIAQVEVGL